MYMFYILIAHLGDYIQWEESMGEKRESGKRGEELSRIHMVPWSRGRRKLQEEHSVVRSKWLSNALPALGWGRPMCHRNSV